MTDTRFQKATALTTELFLRAKDDPDHVFPVAELARKLLAETVEGDPTPAGTAVAVLLCDRVLEEMPDSGESRFSMSDYVDAVANARRTVDWAKLLDLDREGFAAAMIWLATDKRETYSDEEHAQEPLELDVYADPA